MLALVAIVFSAMANGTAHATLYEDGDDAADWSIFDDSPSGAGAVVIDDETLDSAVIETQGTARKNGFLLGGIDEADGWNNTGESHLVWHMAADESYAIYARVDTALGWRYLVYTASNSSILLSANGRYVYHGLGSRTRDGRWYRHSRDLAADLAAGEPDNTLIAVQGFLVRGTIRLDDIALQAGPADLSVLPRPPAALHADAQDDDVSRWRIFDDTPAGAHVLIVDDMTRDSAVYELRGGGRSNGFVIGGSDAIDGLRNDSDDHLSFALNSDQAYQVLARVSTSGGLRWLSYTQSNSDGGLSADGKTIRFGLGGATDDGNWHDILRDLAADIAQFEPGNELLAVHGVFVRGALRLDDIVLSAGEPLVAPPVADFVASVAADGSFGVSVDGRTSTVAEERSLVSYEWDFEPGVEPMVGESPLATYLYGSAGDYPITLTVTDSSGVGASVTRTVTVAADGSGDTAGSTDGGGTDGGSTDGGSTDAGSTDAGSTDGGSTDAGTTDGGSTDGDDGGTSDSARQAARLLAQASFGPNEASIAAVQAAGPEGWIDAQLALPVNPQRPRYQAIASNGSHRGPRHDIWWQDAVDADDQLRQRVAFALSELFVVADTGYTLGNAQEGMVAFYDLLLNGAFGSYRDLLEDVTLSPVMGVWLSMLQNAKGSLADNTRADENFAREVLQLFSIGLFELNADGTRKLADGRPVPTFTTADVESYARVFTGWNFATADRWNAILIKSNNDYESPMTPYDSGAFHDSDTKTLLGGVVSPAGATPQADLDIALDSIANHPNVAPFVSRQLILKLVTSNPTPAYVGRVSAVFASSGGNLGATVKAILLDAEARDGAATVANFGKLREPILRLTHLWRAFDIEPGTQSSGSDYNVSSPQKENLGGVLGQAPLKSPSVFNFFAPDNSPVGPLLDAGLLAPEAELYTEALVLSTTYRINKQIQLNHDAANDNSKKVSHLMLADERALADDPDALLDHLDLLLLSGAMSAELRGILIDHLEGIAVSESDPDSGRSTRVSDAITLIMASPAYLVQM